MAGIRWGYANAILRDFKKLELVSCINSDEGSGRIYRLMPKGARLRTALCKKLPGFKPYKELSDFDWKIYAAIARGRQRRAFLRAMDTTWRTREEIRKRALQFNDRIWRPNAYDVLHFLFSVRLIEMATERGEVYYRLTPKGLKAKELIGD